MTASITEWVNHTSPKLFDLTYKSEIKIEKIKVKIDPIIPDGMPIL